MGENQIKNFEDLECWKSARELRIYISHLSKKFPKEEQFSLTNQILRSARSVTNNIAEGYDRFHYQENIQFCRHSRGSLYETLDHLGIGLEEKYITEEEYQKGKMIIEKSLAILNGFINYLKNKKQETSN